MSWDFELVNEQGEVILFDEPQHLRGGTYCVSGTREAILNVTYNYGAVYRQVFPEASFGTLLDGKTVAETLPVFLKLLGEIPPGSPSEDYWDPTPGNARKALLDLLELAGRVPQTSVWKVS